MAYEVLCAACGAISSEELDPLLTNSMCYDPDESDGLLQVITDKCSAFVARAGLTPDPSYPDPGNPVGCSGLRNWIIEKTEYIENLSC